MTGWHLYAARGIVSKGKFDPSQIEEGLAVGLDPQIILAPSAQNPDVIRELFGYLKNKEISGVPLKITAHGRGEFSDSNDLSAVYKSIDTVVELNKLAGHPVISEVVFHAGAVQNFAEAYKIKEAEGLNGIAAAFTTMGYARRVIGVKHSIADAANHAGEHGVQLVVENVGQVNFAVVPSQKLDDKPAELRKDPRWGDTIWLPEAIQLGDVGCVHDLSYIAGDGNPVCIDVEHLDQSVEYSKTFNIGRFPQHPTEELEKTVLKWLGVFVREGKPVLFREVVNPVRVIAGLSGRIPICHIGGQVSMLYDDAGVRKIGSHMPVTFGDQPNEFYDDDSVRREHNRLREEKLRLYLGALHEAGCRQGVLELHLGEIYAGEKWRHYNKVSLDNVRSIIERF